MKGSVLIFAVFLLFSCKEKVNVTSENLNGKWVVTRALRNHKETKTLQSSFFVFGNDNSINTNFPSMEENTTFTIHGDKLTIGGNPPVDFTLEAFAGDSMQWKGRLGQLSLELYLSKAK